MRIREQIALRWVRGNDVLLRVTLQEPKCDANGYAIKDSKGNPVWQLVDLDSYTEIKAAVKSHSTETTKCGGSTTTDTAYDVTANRSTQNGILLVEVPGTLPNGDYALEITGLKEGKSMRTFEPSLFSIVECNKKANITFDVQEGVRSTDLDIKIQMVASGVARGKNAYELWRELPGNEDKSLQEYLMTVGTGGVDINALLEDYLKKEDISSWAKEPLKPTYTAGEVGAIPSSTVIPRYLSDLEGDSTHRTVTEAEKVQWNSTATLKNLTTSAESYPIPLTGTGVINFKTVNGASIFGTGDVTVTNPSADGFTLADVQQILSRDYVSKVDLATALADIGDDSNVVHKTGDETIEGEKTFENTAYFNESIRLGAIGELKGGSSNYATYGSLGSFDWIKTVGGNTYSPTYVSLQNVLDLKVSDDVVVHRTGNESIGGQKEFESIVLKNSLVYSPQPYASADYDSPSYTDAIYFTNNPVEGAKIEAWGEGFNWIRTNDGTGTDSMISVQDALDAKQDKLVSGVHLKTINGQSLLIDESSTSSDIVITGGNGNTPAVINEENLVHKSSTETITGTKTFNSISSAMGTASGFSWLKDRNNVSLEARLTAIEGRLESIMRSIDTINQRLSDLENQLPVYTYNSSTGTLTFK